MAPKPYRTSRWLLILAKALLLQSSLIGMSAASGQTDTPQAEPNSSSGNVSTEKLASAALYVRPQETVSNQSSLEAGTQSPTSLNRPRSVDPLLMADAGEQSIQGNDVYLDLKLNGNDRGLVHFIDRNGEVWAGTARLRQLGFILPDNSPDPVRLNTLPGLKVDYDPTRQTLSLVAPLGMLNLPTTLVNASGNTTERANASPGALLNYDLYGTSGPGTAASLNAFAELRAFKGTGVFSTTGFSQKYRDDGGPWKSESVRLDTSYSISDQDRMRTLRLGDTLTVALPWSRATRIGGIQFGSNFALQPYQITTPIPAFFGSATLPSEVDLFVNGVRQFNGQVPAGPFQLNTIPNVNGAGVAQVVLTDSFGRTATYSFSLYNSRQLLKKDLSDWSVELGWVRENYGLSSFDYGHDPAASGTWRHGFSDRFTFETHAEATRGLVNGGIGGALQLGYAGILSGSLAGSGGDNKNGSQASLGFNMVNGRFNFGVNGAASTQHYSDVGSLYGNPPAAQTGNAQIGYSSDRYGGLELSYITQHNRGQPASRYLNANWFKTINNSLSVSVSAIHDMVSQGNSAFVALTWSMTPRTTVSAGIQHDRSGNIYTANVSSPAPSEGGLGWNAGYRQGTGQGGGQAEVNYLGRYGRVAAGYNDLSGNGYGYADATGGLVLMGGHAFASRRIDDAFALVSTDGIANVPVLLENRPIGNTDKDGLMLVVPLNAYQNNKLSIDPMQLPADMHIDRVKAAAVPSDRAGTMVNFGITPIRAATVVLVDESDKPLPLGSQVRVNNQTGEPAVVGYDGEVYLDTLAEHNTLEVESTAGKCSAHFDYRNSDDSIPRIGPLRCSEEHVQ